MGSELDYAAIYKDVDANCGTIDDEMTVRRLYVRLDDLVGSREGVRELVVFADVVDVEGKSMELLGCDKVFIMCRLLRIKNSNGKLCTISFPYANRSVINAQIISSGLVWYTASDDCSNFELFIFARNLVMEHNMVITVPFKLHSSKPLLETKNPEVDVEWLIRPDNSCSEESPMVRTHRKLATKDGYLPDGSVDFSKAESHFYVTSPETPPPSILLDSDVLSCIKGSLTALEIIPKFFDQSPDVETSAKAHLEWLITHLSAAVSSSGGDSRLQDLLSRAMAVRQLQTSSIASADMVPYAEVYANVEQATKAVATSECSEVMTVQRMYFLLDDLDTASLKDASVVKELMIYADVVEVGKESLKLPGSVTVIIMCRVFLVKQVPSCTLNFPYLHGGTSVTITPACMDGLGDGATSPSIYAKQLITPDPHSSYYFLCSELAHSIPDSLFITHSDLLACVEGVVLTTELIISYQSDAAAAQNLSCLHLQWLNSYLIQVARSSTSVDGEVLKDLGALLFRVQALLKLPLSYEVVPSLEYTTYQMLIDNLARAAEAYNNEFNRVDLFIRQNEILGSYLVEENKALAEKEKDMEELHNTLVKRKKDELEATINKVDHLQIQMVEQKRAMDKAKEDMDAGLKEYQEKEIAKAFFAVLSAIGECVLAFATGGAAAGGAAAGVEKAAKAVEEAEKAVSLLVKLVDTFKKLMGVVKKVQKVVEVVLAIKDLIEKIVDITKMVDAPPMPDLPSNADWEIFVNEVEGVAENMPKEVSEVATWKCKCKNLAAVCREITTTVVYMQQLEYDLLVESLQAKVAAKHAERLQEIKPADVKNYLEMASQMNMRTTRILLNLLKVFKLQRGALLYHYLLPPKPFTGRVTIDTVRNALIQNAADAIRAMQQLGPSNNNKREYVVCDIPVDLLMQGHDWTFTIPIDDNVNTFPSAWCRVRIQNVEIKFSSGHHQPSTNMGEVYFLLQASRNFQDRGHSGDVLNYEAGVPLYYQYAYNLKSGKTTLSNKPTYEDEGLYMRLTPFTQWRLRLSASAYENQGLSFLTAKANDPSEKTQIGITFHLTAIRTVSF